MSLIKKNYPPMDRFATIVFTSER
uniref:Uncharacterized protein n=1 Tax=Rhizophora mucronata TaxID=61149 RepID=A0A2P2PHK6_RHIMU